MSSPRPPFWLQIRKEYIIDNFDNLLNYLIHYEYIAGAENSDYDSTLACLHELAAEFYDSLTLTPVYKEIKIPYARSLVLRLLCADILASYKVGQQPYKSIIALTLFFIRTESKIDLQVLNDFYNIITNCVRRCRLVNTGFGWSDIINPNIRGEVLIYKARGLKFGPQTSAPTNHFIENNGLAVIPPSGPLDISVVNQSLYVQGKYDAMFEIPDQLQVLVEKDGYEITSDILRFYNVTQRLIAAQEKYKSSLQVAVGKYTPHDSFLVKIISKSGWRVEAETIDPAYIGIKGKLLMELPPRRPKMNTFSDMLKVGNIIRVYRSSRDGYAFEVYDAFEDFYRNYACQFKAMTSPAIFINRYSSGTEWITPEGIRVGIDKSKISNLDDDEKECFQSIIEARVPLAVKFYNEAPDILKEDFNVYAELDGFYEEEDSLPEYTQEQAERKLVQRFFDLSKEESENIRIGRCNLFEKTDSQEVSAFIPLLKRFADMSGISSQMRLDYVTAATMLSRICGTEDNFTYLIYERSFLNAVAQFATNSDLRPLSYPPTLTGISEVERKASIVNTLMNYKKKAPVKSQAFLAPAPETDRINKVEALVSASNSLIDIIDELELNNIKQAITKILGVDDVYEPIFDDRTYYGVESIGLEFKSSVVFPPANKRRLPGQTIDPDLQRWAILKAVCGFLNSRSGGDLLIGVNDAGFAIGVDQDIQILHQHHCISSPDNDHYRLYIMQMMYQAFSEIDKTKPNTDIANGFVDCFVETNAEGRTIMRVKVKPYNKNIVKLAAGPDERPAGIEECYLRLSGRTVAVSPGMREEIMKYKS